MVLKMIKECVDVLSLMYDDLCDVSFGCHSLMGDMVTSSWRSGRIISRSCSCRLWRKSIVLHVAIWS